MMIKSEVMADDNDDNDDDVVIIIYGNLNIIKGIHKSSRISINLPMDLLTCVFS